MYRIKNIVRLFFVFVCSFAFSVSFSQSNQNTCMDELRRMYKNLLELDAMQTDEGRTYYMNYSVRTVPKDSVRDEVSVSGIEMWVSGKNMEISSDQMHVYQDSKDAFVVLPKKNMVLRNDPYQPKSSEQKKMNRFKFIQDTLFSLSKVSVCKEMSDNTKWVVLDVNNAGQQLLSVKRLTFLIDSKEKEFKNVKIEYTKEGGGLASSISYIEYIFKEVNANYKQKKLSSNISSVFMKSDSKLNEKYRGYTLVDNRYKKNKEEFKQLK